MNISVSYKRRFGFTLLEMLVVITIIAILIGLASVSYSTAEKKSRNAKRRGDIKAVQNAFEQYYSLNNGYAANCSTMASSLATGLPTDPKSPTYNYSFTCSSTSAYCICGQLEGETGNSDTANCTYSGNGTQSYYCLSNLQ
ncbi:hypothetical protein C5B42_04860 [Candidatus Cerribacteria bacterium 'Amazon FNV 2010 28 9']|uniref:Type II secretion system protein GspG C-terminal domain-containing protein n=1 Tax=Candidatus Cerribacteria bacterium 'Amazon FNV 2010 28 9' TaxID=2081795 RepID=A0A317JQF4_9BACT|nr:MAG: hypothetical protein C5B42_04860 [Candidatus Cerribacteria bacterium 'Amazon FNV 2010 28 9']